MQEILVGILEEIEKKFLQKFQKECSEGKLLKLLKKQLHEFLKKICESFPSGETPERFRF